MSAKSWGTLIARLFAVYLAFTAIDNGLRIWEWKDQEMDKQFLLTPLSMVAIAVLLWALAGRIMPKETLAEQGVDSDSGAAPAIVACFGAFLFLHYAYYVVDSFLLAREQSLAGEAVSPFTLLPYLAVCVALASVVVNSKRVAGWIVR